MHQVLIHKLWRILLWLFTKIIEKERIFCTLTDMKWIIFFTFIEASKKLKIIDVYLYEEIVKHIAYKQDVNDNIIFYRTDIIFQVPFYIPTPISLMVFFLMFFFKQMILPWRLNLLKKDYAYAAIKLLLL